MQKILFCAYNLEIGGIEKSLVNLLKKIADDYDITLLLQQKKGKYLKEIPNNIKIIDYNLSANKNIILRKITNRFKLIKFILFNRNKFDKTILYTTYDYTSSIITRKLSSNNIFWIHSNYLNLYKKDENKFKSFFDKRKITQFKKVVFVSNEAEKDCLKIYPMLNKKTSVINNLIDFEEIKTKSDQIKIQNINSPTVTFVGRLEEASKGLLLLFDVAKDLSKINFQIIGSGPNQKIYQEYLKSNKINNVKLLGEKLNPYPYIKQTDLIILPSFYEGFPVVILEALTLSKKVLSTINVSSNNFKLEDYIYLTKRNKEILKKDILDVLNQHNKKQFNVQEFNNQNLKLIKDLLEEK